MDVFEEWASSYDDAVTGNDPQYRDVFEGYDTILNEVAKLTVGNVLEFGGLGQGTFRQSSSQKATPCLALSLQIQ